MASRNSNPIDRDHDFTPLVIRGKNAPPSRNININNIKSKSEVQSHSNSMNVTALERKINEGVVTEPPKITRTISTLFSTKRQEIMIGDKKMTQKDLAQRVNLPVADITSIENGSMVMNHENKMKVRKVQRVLNIPHIDL